MFDESEDGLLDDCIEMGNQKHVSINDERAHEVFQILQNKTTIEEQPANNEVIKPELNVNPRRFLIGTFFMLATVILVKTKQ